MSTVSNKIIQAAAGNNNGGAVFGELIEVAGTGDFGADFSLSSAPQAGDLLIAGNGYYANSVYPPSGFTQLEFFRSQNWSQASSSYYESSCISYKIATGTEGTTIVNGFGARAVAVYRFSRPVTSVTKLYSTTQTNTANKTESVALQSSYPTYPQIYACVVGAYDPQSLSMTNQDFSNRYNNVYMAATLRLEGHTPVDNYITGTGNFNEACVYALIAPNFD